MRSALLSATLLAALVAGAAHGDSPESWDSFRAEMDATCRALATAQAGKGEAAVEVNPFGSESYGVALVTLTTPSGTDRMACVLDKRTRRAELTAAFAPPSPE